MAGVDPKQLKQAGAAAGQLLQWSGSKWAPNGGSGQSTIPFASLLSEDKVTVTGQTGIVAGSKIQVSIEASTDDTYAQDWRPPVVRNVVPGAGFDIILRPALGRFKGAVAVNWSWS